MKPKSPKLTRVVGATLIAIVLMAVAAQSIRAQSPDDQKQNPDVQQLKDRVKQLEQTVEELKGQISTIEDAQKQPSTAVSEVTVSDTVAATADTTEVAEKPKA